MEEEVERKKDPCGCIQEHAKLYTGANLQHRLHDKLEDAAADNLTFAFRKVGSCVPTEALLICLQTRCWPLGIGNGSSK